MKNLVFMLIVCFSSTVFAQDTHVPSVIEVDGRFVKVDANIAWIESQPTEGTFRTVEGTVLLHASNGLLSNHTQIADPANPQDNEMIIWELSPGDWEIEALGHPDDAANPNRQRQTFTVTIDAPTREQEIDSSIHQILLAQLRLEFLNVTRAEMIQSLLRVNNITP